MTWKAKWRDRVLERLDLGAFYQGELGDLGPRRGEEVLMLCPFHQDQQASLSINLTSGLFHCFGCGAKGDVFTFYQKRHGCSFTKALEELARQAGAARPRRPPPQLTRREFSQAKGLPEDFLGHYGVRESRDARGHPEVRFAYRDAEGGLVAIRRRLALGGKHRFLWRKGDTVLLYGLWQLAAIRDQGWCLLVEGESDALTCWHHGIPALGIPGKATWKPAWAQELQGLRIYLWQEPDAPELAGKIAQDLPGLLVIRAPAGLKDISQAHCQGQDIQALLARLKEEATPYAPPPLSPGPLPLTDLGNARRLVAREGQNIRYCYPLGKWFIWSGQRWEVDQTGEIFRKGKEVVGAVLAEAAAAQDDQAQQALAQHALRLQSLGKLKAMIEASQSEPGVPLIPEELDRDPWAFNITNGTLNLERGRLGPHQRQALITKLSPVAYDPQALCPGWLTFLNQVLNNNQGLVDFLQQAVGYSLTGVTWEQCLFLLYGLGDNGKSTFLEILRLLLGDYAREATPETFLLKPGGGIPNDLAALRGARLVKAVEVEKGRRLSEVLIKQLTGGDTITARFLYGEYFEYKPQFKIWLATNFKPVIRGADHAIWRRLRLIPFTVQVPKAEQDQEMVAKLSQELPGILNWALAGCLNWRYGRGLRAPPEVERAGSEYRQEMDILGEWLTDQCLLGEGAAAPARDLYKNYTEWAAAAGERRPLSQTLFGMSLAERGLERTRGAGGRTVWRGIGLKEGAAGEA